MLILGKQYMVVKPTPIMPTNEPTSLDDLKGIAYLRPGEHFTVEEIGTLGNVPLHSNYPWYRITSSRGNGWINSIALINQMLDDEPTTTWEVPPSTIQP